MSGAELDAKYDSAYRQALGAGSCDPGTQQSVLEDIMEWIHGDSKSRVLWLTGPVGAGKSTVVHTIAERCATERLLAGSFFFPYSGMGHYWWMNVIPTLAAQFSFTIPGFQENLQSILKDNGDASSVRIEEQADRLIFQPLHSIQLSTPMVVIIDGLEQCEAHHQNSLLERRGLQHSLMEQLIGALEIQSHIHIIISRRFEARLRRDNAFSSVYSRLSHNITLDSASEKDLAIVLRARLRPMHDNGTNSPWPDDKTIGALVWKCSGQFTYAIAVLRFIVPRPPERLQYILGHAVGDHDDPFEQLDELYRQILLTVSREYQQALNLALGAIILLRQPPSIVFLQAYTGMGDIFTPLLDLESLLHVRQLLAYRADNPHATTPVQVRHGSFVEFLLNSSRSGPFFIDANTHHTKLTCFFLKYIQHPPADSSSPLLLQYAAKHWCYHCSRSSPDEVLLQTLYDFDFSKWLASALALDANEEKPSVDGLSFVVKWLHTKVRVLLTCQCACIKFVLVYRKGQPNPRPQIYQGIRSSSKGDSCTLPTYRYDSSSARLACHCPATAYNQGNRGCS